MKFRGLSLILALSFLVPPVARADDTQSRTQQQQQAPQQEQGDDDLLMPAELQAEAERELADLEREAAPGPTPAGRDQQARDQQGGQQQTRVAGARGTSDDDLLEPAVLSEQEQLEAREQQEQQEQVPEGIQVPADPAEQARIDREAASIADEAERNVQELSDLKELLERDPARARAEIDRRLAESQRRQEELAREQEGLAQRLDEVSEEIAGDDEVFDELEREAERRDRDARERARRDQARTDGRGHSGLDQRYGTPVTDGPRAGYGTPVTSNPNPSAATPMTKPTDAAKPAGGEEQFNFFQKLLLGILDGIKGGLTGLAESRTNELKARSDNLALSTAPENRPYADWAVRNQVGDAYGLAPVTGGPAPLTRAGSIAPTPVRDPRLNDLVGAGGPTRQPVVQPNQPAPRGDYGRDGVLRVNAGSYTTLQAGRTVTIERLPRVTNPATGTTHVVVNQPLGADGPTGAIQPLNPR